MAKCHYCKNAHGWGLCPLTKKIPWYPVGVPLSYHYSKRLKCLWSHMNKNCYTIYKPQKWLLLDILKMAIFDSDLLNNTRINQA